MSCKVFAVNDSLDNRDAHAFSPVEIVSLKFACDFDLEPKNWLHDQ